MISKRFFTNPQLSANKRQFKIHPIKVHTALRMSSIVVAGSLLSGHHAAHANDSVTHCSVVQNSLTDAYAEYAAQCSLPLIDCDPLGNQWQCASYQIGNNSPRGDLTGNTTSEPIPAPPTSTAPTPAPAPAPTPTTTVDPIPQASGLSDAANCSVTATTLAGSRQAYAESCSLPRVDCDLINGQWTCAAFAMGASPLSQTSASQPVTHDHGISTGITYGGQYGPPQRGWMDSYSANGRCYIASNFDHGIGSVTVNTPAGVKTVAEVAAALGPGPGIGTNPIYNDVQCGNGPANNAGDEDVNQCPGRVDMGAEGCPLRGPLWDLSVFGVTTTVAANTTTTPVVNNSSTNSSPNTVSGGVAALNSRSRIAEGDLLSIHYDNAGDRDDGLAAVATLMIVDYYGLNNSLHVVNGTYDERTPHFYQSASEPLMRAVFGAENDSSGWWNAHQRYELAINETIDRWRETLQSGHKVWVAEGGTSDFTAEVLGRMANQSVSNLKNVFVVQHSSYNNNFTVASNLAATKSIATHLDIPDGNFTGNGTTGLNQQNDAVAQLFAYSPTYGDTWQIAFNYQPATNCGTPSHACKFDGSDAAAVLYITGDELLRDWAAFSQRFYR